MSYFVIPDKISQDKIQKSFKKVLNVLRKESSPTDLLRFRKTSIDCDTPRNSKFQKTKPKGIIIQKLGTAKINYFMKTIHLQESITLPSKHNIATATANSY